MNRDEKLKRLLERIQKTKTKLEKIRLQDIDRGVLSEGEAKRIPIYYLATVRGENVYFPNLPMDANAELVNLAFADYRYKRAILLGKPPVQRRIRKMHELHKFVAEDPTRATVATSLSLSLQSQIRDMKIADEVARRHQKSFIQARYRYRKDKKMS